MTLHVDISPLKSPDQYRRLSKEAIRHAGEAPSLYFRLSYLGLAAAWRALADESEKAFNAQMHADAVDEVVDIAGLWPQRRPG
jgi:hypothetical protein